LEVLDDSEFNSAVSCVTNSFQAATLSKAFAGGQFRNKRKTAGTVRGFDFESFKRLTDFRNCRRQDLPTQPSEGEQ
jgi:hypothetical protein